MYKVLIVEDEDIIRNGLKYTVDWLDADCVVVGEAANGQEGLERIAELEPDIVILDVNMPIKNGISMVEESINQYVYSSIIISGYDDFKYAQRAIKLGVSEYLLKPVDHAELLEALERAKESVQRRLEHEYIQTKVSSLENMEVLDLKLVKNSLETSKSVAYMIEYIKQHYAEKISIQDLVYPLDMSVTSLNHKFKEQTGYTFNEFLNRYRVQMAIDLLKQGKGKVTMIALDVGFGNYRYFNQVFKKYTNILPSDFMDYFKTEV
jgi:two-component system, response regulator YesN